MAGKDPNDMTDAEYDAWWAEKMIREDREMGIMYCHPTVPLTLMRNPGHNNGYYVQYDPPGDVCGYSLGDVPTEERGIWITNRLALWPIEALDRATGRFAPTVYKKDT